MVLSKSQPRAKRGRAWRALCLVALFLAVWSPAAWLLARALIVEAGIARADAIAVLSGSSTFAERTRRAAELYREGRAPKIILTNDGQQGHWSQTQQRNPFYFERAADELRRAGVPADRIEVLPQVISNTYDEALLLRGQAMSRGLHSLLIVTSAYHSRRALWTLHKVFEGSGIEVGIETPPPGQQTPLPATWWLRPRGWRLVASEYPKMIYYHLRYT